MSYLYPTTTFQPADRDTDGMYNILSGHLHIFPFQVPIMGQQLITMEHMMPGSQDWSINAWFTSKPYDNLLFPNMDNWDDFRLSRDPVEYPIWATDAGVDVEEGAGQILAPGVTYYLNIRNLQNRPNGYRVTFTF